MRNKVEIKGVWLKRNYVLRKLIKRWLEID